MVGGGGGRGAPSPRCCPRCVHTPPRSFVPPALARTPPYTLPPCTPLVPARARLYRARCLFVPPALARTSPALIHTPPPCACSSPSCSFVPPASPSYPVAAVAVAAAPAGGGGSDGAGAAVAAAAGAGAGAAAAAVASVPARLVVWLFVLVPVALDWPYFGARARLGSFGPICLYQIHS